MALDRTIFADARVRSVSFLLDHVVAWVRLARKYAGQGPTGGLRSALRVTSTCSTVTWCTLRRGVPRGDVGGLRGSLYLSCFFFLSLFSGLKNARGWLKVTPNLACSNWQLDSSACKIKTGRGTQKRGTELVVRHQCHAEQVGSQVETGLQDLCTPFPDTRGTNLDSVGSWTPMLSAAKRRVDLSTNFATGEVSGRRADWQLDSSVDVKDSRINWKQDSRIRNCGIQLRATSTGFGSWTPKLCRSFSEMRVEPRNSIWGHWRFRHRMAVASRPTAESSGRFRHRTKSVASLDRLLSRRAASVVLFSRALDSLGLSEVILGIGTSQLR